MFDVLYEIVRLLINVGDAIILILMVLRFNKLPLNRSKATIGTALITVILYLVNAPWLPDLIPAMDLLLLAGQIALTFLIVRYAADASLKRVILPTLIVNLLQILAISTAVYITMLAGTTVEAEISKLPYFIAVNLFTYMVEIAGCALILFLKARIRLPILSKSLRWQFVVFIVLNFAILFFNMFTLARVNDQQNLPIILALGPLYLFYFAALIILTLGLMRAERRKEELHQQQIYNTILQQLIDELRIIKHGYDNHNASILGLVQMQAWPELSEYVQGIARSGAGTTYNLTMCQHIGNPGLAGLILKKLEYARSRGVEMKLLVPEPVQQINLSNSELCEAAGILIDNAIEAAAEVRPAPDTQPLAGGDMPAGTVVISIRSQQDNAVELTVENPCQGKPDIVRMFDKGVSNKGPARGLGLYILRKMVDRNHNLLLNTTADDNRFRQQLIIG